MQDVNIGIEIKKLSHMILRQFLAYEVAKGREEVTNMQGHVLGYLYKRQGRDVFQRDVEADFSISRSTATGILKLMERKGYIRREAVEWDARLKRLALTEQGKSVHLEIVQDIRYLDRKLLEGVSREEQEIFWRVVRRMERNAEREIEKGEGNSC